jgi:7-cyano-7-deazaguanine synthase
LSIAYGQRHAAELVAAQRVAESLGATGHHTMTVDLAAFGGSALTDPKVAVPESRGVGIPVTYVPARNTVFLSLALALSETIGAQDIFIGVNAVDYSGYPDCRPAFIAAFQAVAALATRAAVEGGHAVSIRTPLISMSKADIIRRGLELGVDFGLTVSCYQAGEDGRACGRCDSCRLRRAGFEAAGVADPTRYR